MACVDQATSPYNAYDGKEVKKPKNIKKVLSKTEMTKFWTTKDTERTTTKRKQHLTDVQVELEGQNCARLELHFKKIEKAEWNSH